MRQHPFAGRAPAILVALTALLVAGPSAAVTLTCGNANGLAGQTVTVAVSVGDLTGLGVKAYEFRIGYNASVVTAVGVSAGGSLPAAAGWGAPVASVSSGQIVITAAGSTALAGAGRLVDVSFTIDPAQLAATAIPLTLSGAIFNEGAPPVTLTHGTLTVTATPLIAVTPNTGEIVRGSTLQFTVSGSAVNPMTWSTTDTGVATISGTGLLTGVAPGAVRVNALDAAGHADASNGDIVVRGMGVAVGTVGAHVGDPVRVPVTTTSLSGLGIVTGEMRVSFNNSYVAFTDATAPPGTLLAGAGALSVGSVVNGTTTTLTIVFDGTGLSGAGTLFELGFTVLSPYRGSAPLTLVSALFNETLFALCTSGQITIAVPSTISVLPASVTLLAGQTQQFTTSGAVVPPLTWSALDPAVATIDAGGLLTAVRGGVTRVQAVDAVGGSALSTLVDVYDFRLTAVSVNASPGQTFRMPLQTDRDLGPLDVTAVELALSWPTTSITAATAGAGGAIDAWGAPVVVSNTGSARVYAAGGTSLPSPTLVVSGVDFTLSPSTPVPSDIPVTIGSALFNEGRPRALLTQGVIHVRAGAGTPPDGSFDLALAPASPNPALGGAVLAFTLPASASAGEPVRLTVFGPDGRRVRTLCDERLPAGRHERTWDLRDHDGRVVPAGVYLARLDWMGRASRRKLAVLH